MATQISIDQIKGVPEPTVLDVNKPLVYKGDNIFAFDDNTSPLQTQYTTLDIRVSTLEATTITSVDGGEY